MLYKAFAFLINSNLYISLAAFFWFLAGYAWVHQSVLKEVRPENLYQAPVLMLGMVVFFATLLVYNFDVLLLKSKIKTPASLHRGQLWRMKHYRAHLLWLLFSIPALLLLLCYLPTQVQLLLLFLGFLCLLYYLPYLPGLKIGLRYVPYTKIFLISAIWAAVASALPALLLAEPLISILPLFSMKALFIFGLCLPFDLKDQQLDLSESLKTIPQKLSHTKTLILVIVVHLFFLGMGYWLTPDFLSSFLWFPFLYVWVLCFFHSYLIARPLLFTFAWDGGIFIYSWLLLAYFGV